MVILTKGLHVMEFEAKNELSLRMHVTCKYDGKEVWATYIKAESAVAMANHLQDQGFEWSRAPHVGDAAP